MSVKQRIAYPDDPIAAAFWYGMLRTALVDKGLGIVERFERETGLKMPSKPRSGIETLVDEATGVHREWVDKFVDWFNVNVWGEDPFL